MKFFDRIFRRRKRNKTPVIFKAPSLEQSDQAPNIPNKKPIVITKLPRIKDPVLSFKLRPGAVEFEQPEYNMAEIGRMEDVESYVQRAFTLKEGLMFKEGWELIGKNPQTIKYIRQRFEQFSTVTNKPFNMILRGTGEDLIRYSNGFLVKVRNGKASGGRRRVVPGRTGTLEPVAGYFPMPVSTVKFKRDDNGNLLKYRQMLPSGRYKDFSPNDVIHIFFRRKKGFLVGTPSLVPVKDDIRALRRIEENIEMLIYQNLFPLYHYKVGTETAPADTFADGTSEIDIVRREVEVMPAEGMIVTPERHDITAVGSEGRALRAEGYLAHFKQRVFAGLGVSAVDMGEGQTANRSTADSMSRNLVDDVKHYQRTWEMFINEYIIKELLLESTFANPLDEENIVHLKFSEIDIDSKVKVENHAINSFSGHAITHSELRRTFGKEPLAEDEWKDTFWKRIEEPKMLIQAVDEPYSQHAIAASRNENIDIQPSDLEQSKKERQKEMETQSGESNGGNSKRGPKTTKKTSGQRAAQSQTTPSNQHGTKTSPEKRKSSYALDMVAPDNRLTQLYNDLQEDIMHAIETNAFNANWFKQLTLATGGLMQENLMRLARIDYRTGFRSLQVEPDPNNLATSFAILESRITRIINRLVTVITMRIEDNYDANDTPDIQRVKMTSVFDALRFRSRFIYNSERAKSYNYGIANGLKKLGITVVEIVYSDNPCEKCKKLTNLLDITNVTIDDIPPFHANCTCTLVRAKKA